MIVAAVSTISSFTGIEHAAVPEKVISGVRHAATTAKLAGADVELGYPSSAFAVVLFVAILTVAIASLSGTRISRGLWLCLIVVASLGVAFEVWAAYLAFTIFIAIQLVAMISTLVFALRMLPGDRPPALGLFLTIAPVIGFFAAFRLTVDKVTTFTEPNAVISCNVSVLVQCGVNLKSWQGSLFGFPNPLIGVAGWVVLFMIGVMILGGVTFARWFMIAMNIGIAAALVFIGWLIYQSIFVLTTLCPWCMVTWFVVIPTFWMITLHNARSGVFGRSARSQRLFDSAYGYVPLISLVCYLVIAALAQAGLDIIHHL